MTERKWYQFEDLFTRIDEQLEKLIELQEKQIGLLNAILTALKPQPTPPAQQIIISNINELASAVASAQLPNRLKRIDIDTSNTSWISLRKKELLKPPVLQGFWIEDAGGGFTYKIIREMYGTDEKDANTGDKWNQEYDDIEVKGSGLAGTAKIWVWWRE
jgi:hypothetical protein